MAFLACTSASTYNKIAKIVTLPNNISTVYRNQKMAELITTKNDKAYCLHMNAIHAFLSSYPLMATVVIFIE